MHPVKFPRCFFSPIAGNASTFRSFARAGGWLWGYRIAGTSVGPTRLEPLLGIFLSPVSSGTPLVHRSCRRADSVQGGRVVDLDAARRRRAASNGDGRLPAAAAAPDAARPAQPSIDNPGRAASPPENIFKVKATIIYTGTSNMDKINSGRLQQVTIGLGR